MTGRPSTLERAFELARSGEVKSLTELRRKLAREGYGDARAHTDGGSVMKQLAGLIVTAKRLASRPGDAGSDPEPWV